MKFLFNLLLVFMIISCSRIDKRNNLKTDYLRFIQEYNNFYNIPLTKDVDISSFKNYLNENYNYIDYIKNNYHNLNIKGNLLIIEDQQFSFFKKEYKIDLDNDIPKNNKCNLESFVRLIHIYKDYKKIENNYLREELQDFLITEFDSLVTLPFYSERRSLVKKRKIVTFKYKNKELAIFCLNNNFSDYENRFLVDSIKKKLKTHLNFLKLKYDYLLISVEVN
ncbi:hypothetical protein [Aquimarina rhabdastrellae]